MSAAQRRSADLPMSDENPPAEVIERWREEEESAVSLCDSGLEESSTDAQRAETPSESTRTPADHRQEPKQPRTPADVLRRMLDRGPVVHVPTGIEPLDAMTNGGPRFGDCVGVLGAPNVSKTMLATVYADKWSEHYLVADYCVDEDDEGITGRLGQRRGWHRLAIERREDLDDLFHRLPNVLLYDVRFTLGEVIADADSRADGKPVILICDSVQTIAKRSAIEGETTAASVSRVLETFRETALARGWLIVFTSEMVRSSYAGTGDRTATLAAAKWSGDVEYVSKLVLGLFSVKGEKDLVRVECAKNKIGEGEDEFYLRIHRGSQQVEVAEAPEQTGTETGSANARKAADDAATVFQVILHNPGCGSRKLRTKSGLGPTAIDRALDMLESQHRIENRPEKHGQRFDPHWYALNPNVSDTCTEHVDV